MTVPVGLLAPQRQEGTHPGRAATPTKTTRLCQDSRESDMRSIKEEHDAEPEEHGADGGRHHGEESGAGANVEDVDRVAPGT